MQTLAKRTLPRSPNLFIYDECHCQYADTLAFMDRHPEAIAIGLTATPFASGMGNTWQGMVNVISTNRLIESGYLIRPTIYVAKSPDDADLSISMGEFSGASAGEAGIRIIGNVVEEWIKKTREHFGGPVKTIVFSPTVDHGQVLCRAFADAGFNFQQVSYKDGSDDDRAAKIAEFKRPDSIIHGLVSCAALTKGFDVPDILCGISCRPYRKSLSSHIQEIGRIMRSHEGKDKALWLDHSGNIERFAVDMFDVWENGPGELSKAEKRDSTPRKRDETTREKAVCPQCSGVLRSGSCLACGYERPARSEIVAVEGSMREFDPEALGLTARKGLRADCLKDPKAVWLAALAYTHGHSTRGADHALKWAKGIFHGVYPNDWPARAWGTAPPQVADQGAYALIEREQQRFRKGSKRRRT
ncbi:helicase-related protein [Gemmobacter sp. 24YEA27]|uniref:DEAD/DEAH box helicase n=1 Tax=Gemmobacter sp. 24YEA27 TaxID=3040672 RepID=UPI0024B32662|nr:helicase-related protein [Gemmobacter sp. 24YEA27]